ncbi:hypothetical protein OG543_07850 [Streptomyces sp. NBC_01178]|uniref:hypothetical protein n=1 Tax=Streptomyces sp. NBC_01178 TaxID=2903762 RepID=UPI0038665869|nr:hypothetical protein OG543_07850 [Streptomyces sp. NBC_01178]
MRGRGGLFARRRDTGAGRDRADAAPAASAGPDEGTGEGFLVEDHDGMLLLRTFSDDTLAPADVADLARTMGADEDTVTVIAGAEGAGSTAFWSKLSELLDTLGESGAGSVRLVMAGAGHDAEGRPATARRIADGWRIEVEAPDGAPLVVPGGTLFVPPAEGVGRHPSAGGWWRFAPGKRPEPLGPRSPEPSWQSVLSGLPSTVAGGCVVEQIPAGVLVRPAGAAAARPGDLYHAVPVDPRRLAVVVGVPFGEDVSAEEVAEVLEALPEDVRVAVRLVPGGRRDLLPLAQSVADRLDVEVEVMTGLPLVAASGPMGTYAVRSVLATPDGTPTWIPFVDAVRCGPPDAEGRARPPRLLRWSPPLPGPARPEEGVVGLSGDWQLTVTRAGMWVGPRGGPGLPSTARQVDPGGPVIELGMPGELLDASLWPVLANVLEALAPDLRGRATLHVHGVARDGGRELRRLAARYGLRTLRHAAPAPVRTGPATAGGPARAGAVGAPAPAPSSPAAPARALGRPAAAGPAERPVQGPRTPSARTAAPHRPERTSGAAPATPARTSGRGAGTDRAQQPGEAVTAGAEAGAGANTARGAGASGTPGEAAAPGTAATPGTSGTPSPPGTSVTPGTSGASGTSGAPGASAMPGAPGRPGVSGASGRSAARGERERERRGETFDWSDDRVPTGFAGRARTPGTAPGPASGPGTAPTTPAPASERRSGPAGRPEGREPFANAPRPDAATTAPGEDLARTPGPERPGRAGAADEAGGGGDAGAATAGRTGAADNAATAGSTAPEGGLGPSGARRRNHAPAPAEGPGGRGPAGDAGPAPAEGPEGAGGAPLRTPGPERAGEGAPTKEDGTEPSTAAGPASAATPEPSTGPGPAQGSRTSGTAVRVPDPAPASPGPGARGVPVAGTDPAPATAPVTSTASSDSGAARLPDLPDARAVPEREDTGPADTGRDSGDQGEDVPPTPLPPVLLAPGHRSSEAERTAFRALAGEMWDRHGAAVARALARMPALRGKEQEAARADLIALRMYLLLPEGPLSHGALTRSLRDRELDLMPYGACVASALNRMPSYRGAVTRGVGGGPAASGGVPAPPRPGTLLRDAALLSTVRLDPGTAPPPGGSYVIWSVAGRRVRQFSEQRGPEEVVFAPGTLFRVLAVRRARPGVQIHLRELTGPAETAAPDPEGDRAVLARLEAVAPGPDATPPGAGPWPERCAGAVGAGP